MKKGLKSILVFGLILLSGTLLVACGKGESKQMKAAKQELTIEKILKDNASKDEIKTDLELVSTIGDATVIWSSDKIAVVSIAGKVVRGNNDETVKLTANLKIGEETANKEFSVKVLKVENGTNPEPNPTPNPDPTPSEPSDENLLYSFNFASEGLSNSYSENTNKSVEFTNVVDDSKVNVVLDRAAISTSHTKYKDLLVISGAKKGELNEGSIAFEFTNKINSLKLEVAYWGSYDVDHVVKIVVQTKNNGTWVDTKDITTDVAGTLEPKSITIENLNANSVRILIVGDHTRLTGSGNNGARVLFGDLKFYK